MYKQRLQKQIWLFLKYLSCLVPNRKARYLVVPVKFTLSAAVNLTETCLLNMHLSHFITCK
jgi:hypothetical protein